ncbi:MAG: cytochrome c [Desulfatiglandaceae bacterium]
MRKTTLHRTTGAVVAVLLATAISTAVLRNTVFSQHENGGAAHTHTHDGNDDGTTRATLGMELFESVGCSQCHHADSEKTKIGPGLKGLFDLAELPDSGRPVSEANVMKQLEDPYEDMPSFAERLSPEEQEQIISYLKTL